MAKKKVSALVAELLRGFLADNQYELYNVEYAKEGKEWFLRVFIDRAEGGAASGIGTDDCERVSRFLSEKLDAADPIEQNYYLEVCSPGIDRELLREKDFARFAGQPVMLSLYQARAGAKTLRGILEGLEGNEIVIRDADGGRVRLPRAQVSKARIDAAALL